MPGENAVVPQDMIRDPDLRQIVQEAAKAAVQEAAKAKAAIEDVGPPTPEQPRYRKVEEVHGATALFEIVVDEGWRTSVLCQGMYGWAADWLIGVLQRRPFAPEHRG